MSSLIYPIPSVPTIARKLPNPRIQAAISKGDSDLTQPVKVLVVDDTKFIRKVVKLTLNKIGIEVEEAENGIMAVEKHGILKPDLMIIDLVMPELGGLDAILQIRQTTPDAKVIILSSASSLDEVVTAKTLTEADHQRLNDHVQALLSKGLFDEQELMENVAKAMARVLKTKQPD